MGKASKWFRGLLGLKNSDPNQNQSQKPPLKKKWSFTKDRHKSHHQSTVPAVHDDNDASKHAIAVAAATAAVAEAAVAAAQAAASVVQLTSSGRNISTAGSSWDLPARTTPSGAIYGSREYRAAVMIQSHFRAYLSRRALRALKALVKLQALVRGHLVRKQTAYALRRLQALVRAQVRARTSRGFSSDSPHSSIKSSSHFSYHGPATPEKFEHVIEARSLQHEQQLMMLKRNGSKSNPSFNQVNRSLPTDDDRSDKILEVDTTIPHTNSKSRNLFFYSSHLSLGSDQNCRSSSPSSAEVQSFSTLRFAQDLDESAFCTADNSPAYYSVSSSRGGSSSKRGAFTPTKSEASRSCLSGYSDHPNYMAYTESSKAKVRSLSAPKQRPHQFERSSSSSTKRYSIHGYSAELRSRERVSALHDSFSNKAYPGSGRLDRIGMPISGGNWQRY